MRSPGAQGCAVNVYVLTAVKLWLETFALAAALHSATDIGVWKWKCVCPMIFCLSAPPGVHILPALQSKLSVLGYS